MSESSRRRLKCMVGIACVTALAATAIGAATAVAKPGSSGKPQVSVEPGWPESHFPENDPKPGEVDFTTAGPAVYPPEGMSDEDLMLADPTGYAQVTAERSRIEAQLIARIHAELAAAGVAPASEGAMDTAEAKQAAAALASSAYSPYGYTTFTLVPSGGTYARNGYLGTLYFTYGYYQPTTDSYRWYSVSWPARAGDNRPYNQSRLNVGPIPAYTYDMGFMYGGYRGYEADGGASFYPGKWRLDPWTGAPYGRGYMEIHGGSGSHQFAATNGCIRIYPSAITSLRSYYTYKMANKYDPGSAHLHVRY